MQLQVLKALQVHKELQVQPPKEPQEHRALLEMPPQVLKAPQAEQVLKELLVLQAEQVHKELLEMPPQVLRAPQVLKASLV